MTGKSWQLCSKPLEAASVTSARMMMMMMLMMKKRGNVEGKKGH